MEAPETLTVPTPTDEHLVNVAMQIAEELKWASIDRGAAVRIAQELVGHAQQANIAHGGNGSGQETAALLLSAVRMILGMVKDNQLVATYDQIAAAVARLNATPTVEA